jgi:hypothetical protein
MMPGVTNFPLPSTTTASDGAVTPAPTDTILPSRKSTDALGISCPAAVSTVALRISTGGLGRLR